MSKTRRTITMDSEISTALTKICVRHGDATYHVEQALAAYKPIKSLLKVVETKSVATVTTTVIAKGTVSTDSGLIVGIFDYWCQVMGRGAGTKLTPKRLKNIKARLADGYKVEEIKQAIDGCKMTPFNMGDNDRNTPFNDIELICREGEKLERFIGTSQVSPESIRESLDAAQNESRVQARVRVKNPLAAQQDDFIEGSFSRE